jgi:OmpA-OmpF porin, OOP family
MNGMSKFLIGAGATSLMAMIGHSALGLGDRFVTGLETQAQTALAAMGANGVKPQAIRETSIDRVILLSGTPPPGQTREQIIAAVAAIPGVKRAEWIETATIEPVTTAPAETPASAAAVKDCQADVDAVIKGKTIQFDSGAATLKPESLPLIEALAKALGDCSGTVVAVAGHTDATGNPAANQTLSETRAGTVVAELVNRGIPAARLAPAGYGATKPLQPGTDAAANAANRRIEFSVASAAAATPSAAQGVSTP